MRLKPGLIVLATVLALTITSPVLATTVTGGASLDGAQVPVPVVSAATGTMSLTLDTVTGLLDVTGSFSGLSIADFSFPPGSGGLEFGAAGPFHIHNAPPGVDGNVVVLINLLGYFTDTASGVDISASGLAFNPLLVGELLAGNLYFQLHTPTNPGGEIRGQISAVPEPGTGLLMAMGLTVLGMRNPRARSGA